MSGARLRLAFTNVSSRLLACQSVPNGLGER